MPSPKPSARRSITTAWRPCGATPTTRSASTPTSTPPTPPKRRPPHTHPNPTQHCPPPPGTTPTTGSTPRPPRIGANLLTGALIGAPSPAGAAAVRQPEPGGGFLVGGGRWRRRRGDRSCSWQGWFSDGGGAVGAGRGWRRDRTGGCARRRKQCALCAGCLGSPFSCPGGLSPVQRGQGTHGGDGGEVIAAEAVHADPQCPAGP